MGGSPYPLIANSELINFIQSGLRLEKTENCLKDV